MFIIAGTYNPHGLDGYQKLVADTPETASYYLEQQAR
jgi:hypothetical protein